MLATTDAIVISLQPQTDKAHVLHAYTRAGGRINYRVYGLGRKHAIGMYSPLSLLQITADQSPCRPPTVKEAGPLTVSRPPMNIYQQTVALFISEVLFHVLRHPMPDEPMFDFLVQAVQALQESSEPQNFHLLFLYAFAAKLGFAMETEQPMPHTRAERQKQLQQLCAYFAEHVETWQNPKSLDVLMEVFD